MFYFKKQELQLGMVAYAIIPVAQEVMIRRIVVDCNGRPA
jgi:hypothetical protein